MIQDRQTYSRAAAAALTGLLVQLVLATGVALLGLWAEAPSLHAAAFHLFGGLPIWIVLALLYNQHRLERLEALETEQLSAADGGAASMFEEHGEDLRLSRRRLQSLYRWGLGLVGCVVAVYLLVLGALWLFLNRRPGGAGLGDSAADRPLVLFAAFLAIAFLAFIIARYVAGMTRVEQWQLLRGGAGYLMGSALVCLLVALAALLRWLEVPGTFRALGVVVPVLMLLLGAEVILTFMLSAYRPRRPGEVPRPAFDSRALGLLTSPESIAKAIGEAINYQFGFEISRSWFYQLLSRAITPLVLLGLVVLVAISAIVVVDPHQEAIITRFGSMAGTVGPGVHLKLPWPIGRAQKFPVARVHQISVGSVGNTVAPSRPILWTTEHTQGAEQYLLTASSPLSPGAEAEAASGGLPGMSLVAVDVTVQFRIRDLRQYVGAVERPEDLTAAMDQRDAWIRLVRAWDAKKRAGPDPLANRVAIDPCPLLTAIATRQVSEYCARHTIDELLTKGRLTAGRALRERIQEDVDRHELGLAIVFVGVAGIHPPQKGDVAAAFHEQIGALQQRQSAVQRAQREAIQVLAQVAGSQAQAEAIYGKILEFEPIDEELERLRQTGETPPEALLQRRAAMEQQINEMLAESQGRAAEMLYDALAYRWRTVVTEQAAAERFTARLAAYRRAPRYYRMRLFLDLLAEQLAGARKIVVSNENVELPEVRVDLTDAGSPLDGLLDSP